MMTSHDQFDQHVDKWLEETKQPWVKLRNAVLHHNLARHLPAGPLTILDAGGGNGIETLRLAAQGHTVTLLDYSPEMLQAARENAEASGLTANIRFQHGRVEDIPTLYPEPQFDLVLSHHVIQYMADPTAAIQVMCSALKPGGFLSLHSINRYSEVYREALVGKDLGAAFDQIETRQAYARTFDTTMTVYAAEDLIPALEGAGCTIAGHYGIRCINDYLTDNVQKHDPAFYAALERLELALTDRYPYYLLARMFQLMAQKR
jgi:S-adenosylmethionine-dependent methyltransferase